MKINSINNTNTNFKSGLNNKAVLKGLEFISDHSASFIAGTTLLMSTAVRPIAISLTPKTKKENKQHAIANSITSGLARFLMVEAVALPVENAIKKIDKTPDKYLKKETIDTLKSGAETITKSKDYQFASQFLKLGTNLLTAIPKSMITVALIPVLMSTLFNKTKNKTSLNTIKETSHPIFKNDFKLIGKQPSFKGITEVAAKGIGKILDNNSVQSFIQKNSSKGNDIARNMTIATDLLLTASFTHRTLKNKEIDEKRKKPLILNSLISTGISVTTGYAIDNLVKKNTAKHIEKFAKENINNPNLNKYINGINILRPTLIFAAIYYGILPIISTYTAEKISEKDNNKSLSNV